MSPVSQYTFEGIRFADGYQATVSLDSDTEAGPGLLHAIFPDIIGGWV